MFEVGRLCVKIAGRDARKKAIIVEILDDHFVMIDGEVRRRKCNMKHLEPLDQILEVKDKASRQDVVKAFERIGIALKETKPKETPERPRKQHREKKVKAESIDKKGKKTEKPAKPKKEEENASKSAKKAENKDKTDKK